MAQVLGQSTPVAFLKLIGHPIRYRLLHALAQSDLRVQELVHLLNRPQNLVSYHLQQLRKGEIVHEHRSLADARDIYYSLNLEKMRALYSASGESIHPVLGTPAFPSVAGPPGPTRVLFLCTHNSARSQIAEALLRSHSKGQIEVFSAGTEPTHVQPLAAQVMAEMGIDIQSQRSKSLEEFLDQKFNYIITVCDRAREACPVFPGDPLRVHWSFPDPAAVEGSERDRYQAFRETAVQLNTRIGYLLLVIQRNQKITGND